MWSSQRENKMLLATGRSGWKDWPPAAKKKQTPGSSCMLAMQQQRAERSSCDDEQRAERSACDTDVLVIAVSCLPFLQALGVKKLGIAFGKGRNSRWIPVHDDTFSQCSLNVVVVSQTFIDPTLAQGPWATTGCRACTAVYHLAGCSVPPTRCDYVIHSYPHW